MEKKDLRVIFMGTPEFAVESLKALVEGGFNVVAVVTQPDRPVGRHMSVLHPSEVKQYALSQGLTVLQPEKMKDETFLSQLRSFHADVQVVVAFRMLPEVVWAMPRFGTFNVHASLLPHYRGAAPINWAVINGEQETGVTTFFLDHEIDTGRIIMQRKSPILDSDNVEDVYERLMKLGSEVCIETLEEILATDGRVKTIAQPVGDDSLKPAPKLFKENTRIDWNRSPREIYNFVRGLSPYPTAWTELIDAMGRRQSVKIFSVEPHGENVEILELQVAGKKRMTYREFLNGQQGREFHFE